MNGFVIGILSVTGIGLLCSVVLSAAAKFMAVQVDPRIEKARACLPGANCGSCGYKGCDDYARALVEEEAPTNLCVPGGITAARQVSAVLNRACGEVRPKRAVVRCRGDCQAMERKAEYRGLEGCAAARLLFGGPGTCTYGCLGLGDCVAVCPNRAIQVVNGVARVDPQRCVGCGLCVQACPNQVIALIPAGAPATVLCSSHEKGAAVRKKCSAGCLGCGLCAKNCPAGAITLSHNLAVVDSDKCAGCGTCKEVCPAKCIE